MVLRLSIKSFTALFLLLISASAFSAGTWAAFGSTLYSACSNIDSPQWVYDGIAAVCPPSNALPGYGYKIGFIETGGSSGSCPTGKTGYRTCLRNSQSCDLPQVWNQATFSCEQDPLLGQPQPSNPSYCGVDNPILLADGNKFQSEIDFSSPASDLSIQRQYYSSLGSGKWEWNLSANTLYLYNQGAVTQYGLSAIAYNSGGYAFAYLVRSGGVQLEFKYMGSGVWQTTGLPDITLTEQVNATTQQLEYVITRSSGNREIYNASGALQETVSTQGRRQTYTRITNLDGLADLDKLTITDEASSKAISFVYNDALQIVQAIDPDNNTYAYSYDASGNLVSVTFPDTSVVTYHYENTTYPKALTGITDELNKRYATWGYDANGRANDSRHGANDPAGPFEHGSLGYTMDAAGDVTLAAHTNALGRLTNYHLAKVNGRNLVTHVEGEAINTCLASDSYYTYDTQGYRKTVTDKNGSVTDTTRNSRGLVEIERKALAWSNGVGSTLVETAASQKVETTWHASYALPLTRTYYGWNGSAYEAYKQETTTYTAQNRIATFTVTDLTNISEPYTTNGRTQVWTYGYTYYDANNTRLQQQTVNGPRTDVSDITTYNFDAVGNVSSIVNALGHTTALVGYNSRGQVGSITDANNIVTGMTYTVRGWLDTITYNGTAVTDYNYYANGLLQKVTLPDGSWLQYFYNDARHLVRVENNLGEKIEYTPSLLDGKWTQETVKDASSTIVRQRQRVFDELGRVMTLQGQNGQSWEYRYDQNDNLKTENDALQQLTSYEYDAQNRISETLDAEQNTKAPEDRNAIAYGYDIQGNLSSVTDQRGNTTSYLYDGFGQLIKQTSPDTGTTIFFYDAAANQTGKTDARGLSTTYQYDVLNRLTATLHLGSPAEDVSYTYNATANGNKGVGRLTGYADSNGTTSLVYDAWGLGENVYCVTVMQCFITSYVHNSAGQLISLVYPSGNSVIYGYDTLGRVNAVSYQEMGEPLKVVASNIAYQPFGGMKSITFSNGVVLDMASDNDGRITGITATDTNGTLYGKTYGHTVTDNIQSITDVLNNQNSRSYTYDKLSRLTVTNKGVTNPVITTYGYDEVGNRTDKTVVSGSATVLDETLTYPAGSNRLQSVTEAVGSTSKTYSYDAAGNITAVQGANLTFTYNHGNRMNVSNALTDTTSYVYNALGQRVVKFPNGDYAEATYYHFGSAGQLLAEHHLESSTVLTENVYVNGILLAQMDARDGDLDDDGWTDSQEQACGTDQYNSASTPIDVIADTDGDSQCNALDSDDDNDGDLDVADNCPLVANANQADQDNDGMGDACDDDIDGDTVANAADNCPVAANADQLDTDADLMGDACDTDDDNDGDLDAVDNCPMVVNAYQLDTDTDLMGDLCDADMDNDGLVNLADNCPTVSNLDQLDTDGDLLGNACDADDDNDGVTDPNDAYPLISLNGLMDHDNDGRPSDCDAACQLTGMMADIDDDNDGVEDMSDAYPLISLNGTIDADDDGRPDNCDSVCQAAGMMADDDDDNDSVLDSVDNCPIIANANQMDSDSDLAGDACDTDDDNDGLPDLNDAYPLASIGSYLDTDNDGAPDKCNTQCQSSGMGLDADDDNDSVLDGADNCPLIANADQLDTDGDLTGNACDADDDNDLVSDVIEQANGLDPANPWDTVTDNDSDGYTLGQELVQVSDPASLLSIPANEQYIVGVGAAGNDVEFASNLLRVNNGYLELFGSTSTKSVGLRFSLPIKKSAEIVSASLNAMTWNNSSPVSVTIALENSSNATQFTNPSYPRTYLTNTVGWSFTYYPGQTALQSPNLASLLSQVVNASTWSESNHVFFKLTPLASSGFIRFWAYEGNPNFAVKLNVQVKREKWDSDLDTVIDSNDNCPFIANVNQSNTDADSAGDACDAFSNDPFQQ